jgi:hypothetical protein
MPTQTDIDTYLTNFAQIPDFREFVHIMNKSNIASERINMLVKCFKKYGIMDFKKLIDKGMLKLKTDDDGIVPFKMHIVEDSDCMIEVKYG